MRRARPEPDQVLVVDSHTEGEPTRVVVDGWPLPGGSTMQERVEFLRKHHDYLRQGVVLEPRGHDAVVGALLTPPVSPGAASGVIFFNDVGYLGMCGHGLIGVVRTLQALGRAAPGRVTIDTPVGTVSAVLDEDGAVTVRNVPAFVHLGDVRVVVPGIGPLRGSVAWGGNWFFLTRVPGLPLELSNVRELTRVSMAIRDALRAAHITGKKGAEIDHIELFGPPSHPAANSKNFVLCPGAAYDRSPCGTGTSAKMACLYAEGELQLGELWVQESITGSLFTGWLEEVDGTVTPHVRGRAYVTGRTTLVFDARDPFRFGLQPA